MQLLWYTYILNQQIYENGLRCFVTFVFEFRTTFFYMLCSASIEHCVELYLGVECLLYFLFGLGLQPPIVDTTFFNVLFGPGARETFVDIFGDVLFKLSMFPKTKK